MLNISALCDHELSNNSLEDSDIKVSHFYILLREIKLSNIVCCIEL